MHYSVRYLPVTTTTYVPVTTWDSTVESSGSPHTEQGLVQTYWYMSGATNPRPNNDGESDDISPLGTPSPAPMASQPPAARPSRAIPILAPRTTPLRAEAPAWTPMTTAMPFVGSKTTALRADATPWMTNQDLARSFEEDENWLFGQLLLTTLLKCCETL